ncbi:MAG: acyltransferase [Nitrospirae bacterium]|nr:acyltransferase [Nitrospirota bacterium]
MDNQAYKLSFKHIGQDVIIWPKAKIVFPEVISIGDSVIIDDFVFLTGGKETHIKNFVHIASFSSITGGGEFIMEDFSGLSGGVKIYTGNEDYSGSCLTNPTVPFPYRQPIRSFVHIKKHAIIGANSVILPGVVINEGAVVGANSLITKDCEPWKVYFGSPARIVNSRPSEKIFELETQLRKKLYDNKGNYIPKDKSSTP